MMPAWRRCAGAVSQPSCPDYIRLDRGPASIGIRALKNMVARRVVLNHALQLTQSITVVTGTDVSLRAPHTLISACI